MPNLCEAPWRRRCLSSTFCNVVAFRAEHLALGLDTVLYKLGAESSGHVSLRSGEAAHDRMVALLAVAGHGRLAEAGLAQVAAALGDWRRGDRGLAAIRLAFAPLPRLRDREALLKDFSISAPWRSRAETPAQIAHRLKSLLALLRPITPQFERWYQVITEDNVPELDDDENWLVSAIAADVCTGDLGEPIPALGYFLVTMNEPTHDNSRADQVYLDTHAGSIAQNNVALRASHNLDWDAALVAYPVVRKTVLAFAETFEPLWCEAGPFSLWRDMKRSIYKEGPIIVPCWMISLSPPLARRITPPSDVISERFADGSLFLSVTDETFDPDRPAHVEAARRLFDVLDTLQEKQPLEQRRG